MTLFRDLFSCRGVLYREPLGGNEEGTEEGRAGTRTFSDYLAGLGSIEKRILLGLSSLMTSWATSAMFSRLESVVIV